MVLYNFSDSDLLKPRQEQRRPVEQFLTFSLEYVDVVDLLILTYLTALAFGIGDGLACGWSYAAQSGGRAGILFLSVAPPIISFARDHNTQEEK